MSIIFTIIVNDTTSSNLEEEHGFSLALETEEGKFLFDTGAGSALLPNMTALGVRPEEFQMLFLSHGHYDHTGGLADFLTYNDKAVVWHGENFDKRRFSFSRGPEGRDISMPEKCQTILKTLPAARNRTVVQFEKVTDSLFLTGPIPRDSFEDCGAHFYLDEAATIPDSISDEISLLVRCNDNANILITGCCHSGIINTVNYCHRQGHRIDTIIGGLHLNHATEERLAATARFLNEAGVKQLYLLHCTGSEAVEYLSNHFCGMVYEMYSGETLISGSEARRKFP